MQTSRSTNQTKIAKPVIVFPYLQVMENSQYAIIYGMRTVHHMEIKIWKYICMWMKTKGFESQGEQTSTSQG